MSRASAVQVKVTKLCEMLGDQLDQTKSNIEKKQSRTFEELQEELTAMETEVTTQAIQGRTPSRVPEVRHATAGAGRGGRGGGR